MPGAIMTEILSYFPGRQVTVFLETQHVDSPTIPTVNRIILPNFTSAPGYPQNMTRLDTGLYFFQFVLPTGGISVGSYFIDIIYTNPITNLINYQTYQVVVTSPFGNYAGSVV
jgi:hypothetical protein